MIEGRIDEAIKSYRESIRIIEMDLKSLLKVDSLEIFYKIRPINGWETLVVIKRYNL